MHQNMYKYQHIQNILIEQLPLFNFDHGQYPSEKLKVVINARPLLSMLQRQNTVVQQNPRLLSLIYWQKKQQNKTLTNLSIIAKPHHRLKITDNNFYLRGLSLLQQDELIVNKKNQTTLINIHINNQLITIQLPAIKEQLQHAII